MSHFTLRRKLTAIFVLLAGLGAASGAVGLFYFARIGNTVSLFADTTSPMLASMTNLVENSLTLEMTIFSGVHNGDSTARLRGTHAAMKNRTGRQIDLLREQVAQAGVDVPVERAARLGNAFNVALDEMIGAYEREQAALAQMQRIRISLDATLAAADSRLRDSIRRSEAEVARVEEQVKIDVQMGRVSVDAVGATLSRFFNGTYRVLESSRWLVRLLKEVGETATLVEGARLPAQLDAFQKKAQQIFAGGRNVLGRLVGRAVTPAERQRLDALAKDIEQLGSSMTGPDGLIARQRELLAARDAFDRGRRRVLEMERAYFALLGEVRQAVSELNLAAKRSAERSIVEARIAFAASLLVALAAAVFFAHRIEQRLARPLSRVTSHAAAIGESGELVPLAPSLARRTDEIGMLSRAFNAMIEDLAEARRQLIEQSEAEVRVQFERLNAAVDNMPQGLSMFDSERRLVVCNSRFAELYNLKPEHTVPGTLYETILRYCGETLLQRGDTTPEQLLETFGSRNYGIYELADGRTVAVSRAPMPAGGSVATHEDITERRRAEEKIAHMAMHDMLTDLPNRVSFREALTSALARLARTGEEIAVLYFDLDHFKNVNDSLGHPVGDALLKAVARRLSSCVRETDGVARLGGDEFAIVQTGAEQPAGAAELAARLVAELSRPYEIEGQQVVIGASVGIALAPDDGEDPDTLLRNADMALYRSKELGRRTYSFFEADMDARMQARRTLEMELRRALVHEEFALHYQPVVDAETGKVGGFEALLRWHHPVRGMIPPAEFVPVAEETGLITDLGAWVLSQACSAAVDWPDDVRVSVNLAPAQFVGGRVLEDVRAALLRSGLAPARLELEITETMLMKDTGATVAMLERLHALGVRVSMDDFGTGYSSLGYLRKFPFDKIKIDRSFVRDLDHSRDAVAIVRAVNGLAAALGIETVAEGVETGAQLASARSEGCSAIQGDLFSRPVPAEDISALFAQGFKPQQREGAPDVRSAA